MSPILRLVDIRAPGICPAASCQCHAAGHVRKRAAGARCSRGDWLVPYRKAADIIEASGLDYTILRPAWLTDADEMDYETTQKGEPFKGTEVSRESVAALIVDLIHSASAPVRQNLGVDKSNTDGDKPAFL